MILNTDILYPDGTTFNKLIISMTISKIYQSFQEEVLTSPHGLEHDVLMGLVVKNLKRSSVALLKKSEKLKMVLFLIRIGQIILESVCLTQNGQNHLS